MAPEVPAMLITDMIHDHLTGIELFGSPVIRSLIRMRRNCIHTVLNCPASRKIMSFVLCH